MLMAWSCECSAKQSIIRQLNMAPFSGGQGEYRIACVNTSCPVKPHTQWLSSQEYVVGRGYIDVEYEKILAEKWNTRAK